MQVSLRSHVGCSHSLLHWPNVNVDTVPDKDSFINMLLDPQNGLMRIYSDFGKIKFKGKGHERSDLRFLMKKYEEWCHDLCPVIEGVLV